jgi:hypothetical protein
LRTHGSVGRIYQLLSARGKAEADLDRLFGASQGVLDAD